MGIVIAIDAGTTGIRSTAVNEAGHIVGFSYEEFTQHFPQPGWVEHDASEIWETACRTMADLVAGIDEPIAAIGITNQRETVVAWDRSTGEPVHNAIVWQDRRTADATSALEAAGHLPLIRQQTGLVLDPYFSASKITWLLGEGGVTATANLALGTVETWLIWKLTGGESFVTEPSNASRTLLFDLDAMAWSPELCELFGVPAPSLAEIRPSSGDLGTTTDACPLGAGIPIAGAAGDQQAALFGQACFSPGDVKNTYGTGSFVVMNAGETRPAPVDGLLTSVGWQLADGSVTYVLEGAIFVTGAAVQWLRDGLGIIERAEDLEPLAGSCDTTGGVVFVPALTGLGSPWWDPEARGTIVGLTRGTGRAEIARAAMESMVFQTRDVVDAMSSAAGAGRAGARLRVDGGAAAMNTMLQMQADQLAMPVDRPANQQTTVMGAAYLAGLATGVWSSLDDIAARWVLDQAFEPKRDADRSTGHQQWLRAVERSRNWAGNDAPA